MTIGVLGAGYVGLATAASFAARGFAVVCFDVNKDRIAILRRGELPFFEGGMLEMLQSANIPVVFTDDQEKLKMCDVMFCCVGTPSAGDGSADLSFVYRAAQLSFDVAPQAIFIIKSTVPPGTSRAICETMNGKLRVATNPEFLREGKAIIDALHPSRVVIGADDPRVARRVQEIYADLTVPKVVTNTVTAEMVKYASNSFLATKVSFINEIASLCDGIGADVRTVAEGMGLDDRIGSKHLQPGPGYGGSCFPKDVRALLFLGESVHVPMRVLAGVVAVNHDRQRLSFQRLCASLGNIGGKRIAVWGLAFKPDTDDIRESPALVFIEQCLQAHAIVVAYDPRVREALHVRFPQVLLAASALDALQNADALVVMTDWPEFRGYQRERIERLVTSGCVIDLWHALG